MPALSLRIRKLAAVSQRSSRVREGRPPRRFARGRLARVAGATAVAVLMVAGWSATAGRAPAPVAMARGQQVPGARTPYTLTDCTPGVDCVGDLNDYAAMTQAGNLTSVKGSFANFTPGTAENGQGTRTGSNVFSLQLNTNTFPTSLCSGCLGWVQFVYRSDFNSVYIQYRVENYGGTCPGLGSGWLGGGGQCFMNSSMTEPNNKPPTALTVSQLDNVTLTGTVAACGLTATLTFPASGTPPVTQAYTNCEPDLLGLDGQWTQAEWGIFGADADTQAYFTNPASINLTATTTFVTGQNGFSPLMKPVCVYGSGNGGEFTGETNSLYLQAPQLQASAPALISTQTSNPPSGNPEDECAYANTYNEPHLKTFGNLFYDFQATGDFDLAASGPHFIVENRQVPLPKPNQNLAVNQAIAARLGTSDVAVCTAPTRLLINKRPVHLASGGHVSLPGGGGVWLNGTTYVLQDTAGDTVRATVNTGHPSWSSQAINWVNAAVYLLHRPATLHGLLANPPNNPSAVQASNGTVLTPPFNFQEFYGLYGNSWRVPASQSLLSACGKPPASTNPSNVYYSGNLPTKVASTARAECLAAGVPQTPALLDACTLDVAILGKSTAQDYLNMPTNLTWGQINPPSASLHTTHN